MRSSTNCRFRRPVWRLPLVAAVVLLGLPSGVTRGAEKGDFEGARRLVDEAMRAEVAGDETRRASLLREAIDLAPDFAPARWHSGQIEAEGAWRPIPVAEYLAAEDPSLVEYRRLREACGDSPAGQLVLARWCRGEGLDDEARFHWAAVLSVQPNNQEALRALGMRWFRGRLLTHARIKQLKEELTSSRNASRRWTRQVTRWAREVSGEETVARNQALHEVQALDRAEVIPAIEEFTLSAKRIPKTRSEACRQISLAFLEALNAMSDHAATQSLVRHAVVSAYPDVRWEAANRLKPRPPHDYVPMLLDELAMPIKTWFQMTVDPDGSVHYTHSLSYEGPFADWSVERTWSAVQINLRRRLIPRDGSNLVNSSWRPNGRGANVSLASRHRRRFGDEAVAVERQVVRRNQSIAALNERITAALTDTTGQDLEADPREWWGWWQDYNENYTPEEKPVYRSHSARSYYYSPPRSSSCFAAGTSVWTKTGPQPIESLELGDLVLSQDVSTGELAYQPVIGTTVRPPTSIAALDLGGELVRATLGHPFWVSGGGWKMVKKLEAGTYVHSLHGPVPFVGSEPVGEFEAYNLIVAGFHTYFVGDDGLLVHDNTPRQPTSATVPGWSPESSRTAH